MTEAVSSPDLSALQKALQRYWGYTEFRPLQLQAMQAVLAQRDSLVVLPTGGGKSLCFQAPAVCLEGLAVIISPLIALMKDQVDALRANGIAAACINSSLSSVEKRNVADDIRNERLKLLYVAPERLALHGLRDLIGPGRVSFFAVDEAHCVSMWGHDFRPHYRELRILKQSFPGVGIHAYTATATQRVRDDVIQQLQLDDPEVLVGNFDRPNLTFRVERRSNILGQIEEIVERHRDESGIIYCISRAEVDSVSLALNARGYSTAPYHAGMSDQDRKANQEAFVDDRVRTIVATVAFGMGIDKSDVRYVIHAGMPKSLEHYQQESGRAGRDGLEAECCLFHTGNDYLVWERMLSDQPPDVRRNSIESLKGMTDYCTGADCRHRMLVQHFDQELSEDCGNACDICLGEFEPAADPLVIGQKILSSVYRQGQNFGAEYTALVLKGSKDARVLQNGHDKLSTYGILSDESKRSILQWIGQLTGQGFLRRAGEFSVLQLSDDGRRLLRGELVPRLLRFKEAEEDRRESRAKQQHDAHSWEGVDRGLFDDLRSLRLEKAEDRNLPPYMVFDDASLRDMARRRPSTMEGFLGVRGVGQKKAADYGEEFVARIVAYCRDQEISMDAGEDAKASDRPRRAASTEKAGPSLNAVAAFGFFDQGMSIPEIATRMGRAPSTVLNYLAEYIADRGITDAARWVEAATVQQIEAAIDAVGDEYLRPIREHLQETVDYEPIRIVRECRRARQAAETRRGAANQAKSQNSSDKYQTSNKQ